MPACTPGRPTLRQVLEAGRRPPGRAEKLPTVKEPPRRHLQPTICTIKESSRRGVRRSARRAAAYRQMRSGCECRNKRGRRRGDNDRDRRAREPGGPDWRAGDAQAAGRQRSAGRSKSKPAKGSAAATPRDPAPSGRGGSGRGASSSPSCGPRGTGRGGTSRREQGARR